MLDEMISDQVAERLSAGGTDVMSVVADPELRSLSDPEVFALAQTESRATVTYNIVDFQPLARERISSGSEHSGLVLVNSQTIPPADLARLTHALERFLENFAPWPSFEHWLSEQG